MDNLQSYLTEYQAQLKNGMIQKAYRGLMEYISCLRTYLQKRYPQFELPGNLYMGYMDMTYFSIVPPGMKPHKLKFALVYLHEAARFEIWLSGANKQVQADYWQRIKLSGWDRYPLVPTIKGSDAIIEKVLIADPNFDEPDKLTDQIESETISFITVIEQLVSDLNG